MMLHQTPFGKFGRKPSLHIASRGASNIAKYPTRKICPVSSENTVSDSNGPDGLLLGFSATGLYLSRSAFSLLLELQTYNFKLDIEGRYVINDVSHGHNRNST